MEALLDLPEPLLHEVDAVDELLDGGEQVQVCLGDLLARRFVHAVHGTGSAVRGRRGRGTVSGDLLACRRG